MSKEDQGVSSRSGETDRTKDVDTAIAGTVPQVAVKAWYARPLFWSGFLLAGILALLGWLAWQAWQTAEAKRIALEKELAEAREANQARENFIQQLKLLLQAAPCDIPAEMARLVPPPGIIWPPLGSGSLPLPDSIPDQTDPVSTAPILPGQKDDAPDPGNGLENQGLNRSQTDSTESAGQETGKAKPDLREVDSFGPLPQKPNQPDDSGEKPEVKSPRENPERPERSDTTDKPDRSPIPSRGMRI